METGEQSLKQRLLAYDIRISAWLGIAERQGFFRTAAAVLAHSGDSWFWLAGLGLLWLFGSDYWKQRAAAFALGILVTALLVLIIKFTVRRRRPDGVWGGDLPPDGSSFFPIWACGQVYNAGCDGSRLRANLVGCAAAGMGSLSLSGACRDGRPLSFGCGCGRHTWLHPGISFAKLLELH